LSCKFNQDGTDALKLHEIGVVAPVEVNTTELGAPAMNVADVGWLKDGEGAGGICIATNWLTVPCCELDAVMLQPGRLLMQIRKSGPGIPLKVPVPFPLSVNVIPGIDISVDSAGGGTPVVVTRKFRGTPAFPLMTLGEVMARVVPTSMSNVCKTALGVSAFEAARVSW
jgi:hypothetical protein